METASQNEITQRRVLLILAAVCLLLALVRFHVYWPYQLSRWVLCAGGIWLACKTSGWRRVAVGTMAVIYNPLLPFHFGNSWPWVNGISVAVWLAVHPAAARIFRQARRKG